MAARKSETRLYEMGNHHARRVIAPKVEERCVRGTALFGDKNQAQGRPVGDGRQGDQEDEDVGNGCLVELEHRTLEAEAGDEEVDSQGWEGGSDLQVG